MRRPIIHDIFHIENPLARRVALLVHVVVLMPIYVAVATLAHAFDGFAASVVAAATVAHVVWREHA